MKRVRRTSAGWNAPLHVLGAIALACLASPAAKAAPFDLELRQVATGLTSPTSITAAGDGSGRLFVSELDGTVRIFDGNALLANDFLDIGTLVERGGGEQGLLAIAFHPSYASNGFFYVHYSSAASGGDAVIARYSVNALDANDADESTALVLLTIDQDPSFTNHNGGDMHFGPDGYLYIALGDDGGAGDPAGNAQDRSTLPGSLLRIDVDTPDVGLSYGIPATNPFVGEAGVREEIWAYGLRNPWRFSFDRTTGDLFIADVGQSALEEIDFQPWFSPGGENYGWNCKEGTANFDFGPGCAAQTFVDPIVEYAQLPGGCFAGGSGSVTGGYRYRGPTWKALSGLYLFADFCTGQIYQAEADANGDWTASAALATNLSITTFGEGDTGEIFLAAQSGALYAVPEPGSFASGLAALAALALLARRAAGAGPTIAESERVTSSA